MWNATQKVTFTPAKAINRLRSDPSTSRAVCCKQQTCFYRQVLADVRRNQPRTIKMHSTLQLISFAQHFENFVFCFDAQQMLQVQKKFKRL